MDMLWPGFLALLGLLPIMLVAYIWLQRKRKRYTVRYSSLSLVREALSKQSQWRRHLPFVLLLLGTGNLGFAMTRPVSIAKIPTNQTTVIMAMDVSLSMCSKDIPPNRLDAAKAAALEFVRNQKPGTRIGVVAFAGFAEVIQSPTDDLEVLTDAINGLATGRRTAIGSAILKSIDAIAEVDPKVARSTSENSPNIAPPPVAKGAYVPEIIVLLTDGASNAGPMPVDAAQQAKDRGIRVYTIGFGTANGAEMAPCGARVQGREPSFPPGFGGGGGGRFRRGIDEETLKEVAALTDAEYYSAESASELSNVYNNLPLNLVMKTETTEITFVFAAIGALLATLAITLALLWNPLS
jgi:Ca-activated chloride channel family protein